MTLEETARAKINLDLRICHRREDGYHDLDSLVVFTDFGDQLRFNEADQLILSIEGPFADALFPEQDNLILRAAKLLASLCERSPNVHITLDKRLPLASGIGGGSADAAATLRGLVQFWGLPMTMAGLSTIAPDLGADVPVCLGSRPVLMTGIGDRLTPLDLPAPLPILLVNPGEPVATGVVFDDLSQMSGARPETFRCQDVDALMGYLAGSVNDLEAPARRVAPIIDNVLEALSEQIGCKLARMSGSGATCFGLFSNHQDLDDATKHLKENFPGWWVVQSICR